MEKTKDNVYIIDHEGDDEIEFTVQRTKSSDANDELICFTTDDKKKERVFLIGMNEAKTLVNVLNHLINEKSLLL